MHWSDGGNPAAAIKAVKLIQEVSRFWVAAFVRETYFKEKSPGSGGNESTASLPGSQCPINGMQILGGTLPIDVITRSASRRAE